MEGEITRSLLGHQPCCMLRKPLTSGMILQATSGTKLPLFSELRVQPLSVAAMPRKFATQDLGPLGGRGARTTRAAWNTNKPCFNWKGPCFGGFKPQKQLQRDYNTPLLGSLLTNQHMECHRDFGRCSLDGHDFLLPSKNCQPQLYKFGKFPIKTRTALPKIHVPRGNILTQHQPNHPKMMTSAKTTAEILWKTIPFLQKLSIFKGPC